MLAGVGGQHRMARPYSRDLRDRVVAAVASGRTCRATAALFGVSVASVVKWSQRWRDTGSAAAKPMGGRRPLRLKGERALLLARIGEKPDLTLRAVMAELAERGTRVSYGAVWRFFKHEGITFKKKSARQRAGSRRHRPPHRRRKIAPRRQPVPELVEVVRKINSNSAIDCASTPAAPWLAFTRLKASQTSLLGMSNGFALPTGSSRRRLARGLG